MSGDPTDDAARPGARWPARRRPADRQRGLLVAVKVEQWPAEHTEGRQSTRLDALASHRQELRCCRSEMT